MQFASGFFANYAVAIDSQGNANLFQISSTSGTLTFLSSANFTHTGNTYGFSFLESSVGLTANSGASFGFVATLSNADQSYNNSNGGIFYRSNETIGASNVDNNAAGNLGNSGTLIYSGFDSYVTAVPEPDTWLEAALCVLLLGKTLAQRQRPPEAAA